VRSFTESYLSDIDNTILFESTAPVNQNKKVKIKERRAEQTDLVNRSRSLEWYIVVSVR